MIPDATSTTGGGVRLLGTSDLAWRERGPGPDIVRAFGLDTHAVRRLPGGAGQTFTDGRLVVKPVGCVPEHDWVCDVYAAWDSDAVRVPEPVPPDHERASGWSVDGWGAHVFVPGRDLDLPRDLDVVREASAAFHRHVAGLSRPDFLDVRDDPWSYGDRLAWECAEPEGDDATLALVLALRSHLAPVSEPDQVIHGDLLPNVLAADGLPPAVIDWPPYFRPAGTADAVVVTDAITFRDAPLSLLDEWQTGEDWAQLLIRALLYRLGPTGIFAARGRLLGSLVSHVERARPLVEAVLAR